MSSTASEYFDQGVEHYDNSRFERAIACFDEALGLEPDMQIALHNRALAKFELGHHTSAITDLDEVIRQTPENAGAYADRGYIRLQTGDPEAALADLDTAINIDPENSAALVTRGTLHARQGRIKMALADFERAIAAANPEYAEAYVERAALWERLGDIRGALEDYNAAIEQNPGNAAVYLSRGRLHGKVPGAEALAAADYSRFLHLAYAQTIEANSREIFTFFEKYPAPFLLRRILPRFGAPVLLPPADRIAEQCRPMQLYLDWLDLQQAEQRDPLNYYRLRTIVHFYMGDPAEAYYISQSFGAPKEEVRGLPDLMSAYYFIESAKRFHEPFEEQLHQILHALREQRAVLISRKNLSDLYYAGLIFFANGRLVEAEEFFAAAEAYLPAAYLYLQTLQLMSDDAELIESKMAALRAREAALPADQGYLHGFPTRQFQAEFSHFFAPFQHYAHYREVENVLPAPGEEGNSLERTEIWAAFQWPPEKRDWVQWMLRREALGASGKYLAARLRGPRRTNLKTDENLARHTDALIQQLEQDNWALTLHESGADFRRAAAQPPGWHTRLSALISHRDFPLMQDQARLVEYFYRRGDLPVWDALPMYFYIAYVKDSGEQDAGLAEIIDPLEKMVEWLFDPLGGVIPAAACAALLQWLQKFRDDRQTSGSADPDAGGPLAYSPAYAVFMQDFLNYLAVQRELAGEQQFDGKYSLKPFFDWQDHRGLV